MNLKKIIKNNLLILIILITGLTIRLIGMKDVGISDYDTAYYANIAKVPIFTIDWFFDKNINNKDLEGLAEYLKERGSGAKIIKPGHVFLIFLSFLIFGVKDYAILAVSTICSIGVIILTYIIGYKLFNKSIGLIGSAIIAVSGQNIIYSRTGYPQADTTLLFCITFLFLYYHLNSINRGKYFWYSGIFSGLLLLFHQSAIVALVPLFIIMLFNFVINPQKKCSHSIIDCIYFISIMITIFFASEYAIDYINQFNSNGGQELSARLYDTTFSRAIGYFGFSLDKLLFYPRMFWILEGSLVTILIPLSITYVAWKSYWTKSINYLMISLVTCLPLFFWLINYTTLKGIQVLMPFIAICVGIAVNNYSKNTIINNFGINLFISIILFSGLLRSSPIISFKPKYNSVFSELEKYLESQNGQFNANQNNLWPISYFYCGNMIHNNPSQFGGKIIYNDQEEQTDFKIIDWSQFIPGKNNIKNLIDIDKYYYPIIKKEYGKIAQPIWNYHRYYDINRYPNIFNKYPQAHFISVYDIRNKNNN